MVSRAERRRAAKLAKKTSVNDDPVSLKAAVHAHYKSGDLTGAKKLMTRLLRHTPQDPAALSFAGMLASETGDLYGAIEYYSTAHALKPSDELNGVIIETLQAAMHAALTPATSTDVIELAERLLVRMPQSLEAVSLQSIALTHCGRTDEAEALLGMQTLVEIRDLDPPEGWQSMEAFNTDLAEAISSDPSMAVPDKNHPTYHNRHLKITAPFDIAQPGPIDALTSLIEASVNDYRASRSTLDHPFLTRWPASSALEAWGTLLEGEGTVDSHIHLEGYLGMVYYPELPPEVAQGQGWLELGRPPDDFPLQVDAITQLIEPAPGRLVMFPGYLFHRTTPFNSQHRRISVAYDVVVR